MKLHYAVELFVYIDKVITGYYRILDVYAFLHFEMRFTVAYFLYKQHFKEDSVKAIKYIKI